MNGYEIIAVRKTQNSIEVLEGVSKLKKTFEKLTICNLQIKKVMFNAQLGAITRLNFSLQLYS